MELNAETNIIAVEPSAPIRQLLVAVLKAKNMGKAQGVASVKDAIALMEVEKVDWIITPLARDQDINAMQVLALATSEPKLRHLRVTLMVDETEDEFLEFAFSKGLFSYFSKKFNKDSLGREFDILIEQIKNQGGDDTKTSAFYLRQHLRTKPTSKDLIHLENALLNIYPGDRPIFLELASAYYRSDDKDLAKQSLIQYHMLEGSFPSEIEAMVADLQIDTSKIGQATEGTLEIRALPLKNAVVIDPDDSRGEKIERILKSLGVEAIQRFNNGEGAWLALERAEEPNLLILQWQVPKIPGPILLQKLKAIFPNVPTIVMSDDFDVADVELLSEMGVTASCKSTFEDRNLIEILTYSIRQHRYPSEVTTLEQKIRKCLESGDVKEAVTLREKHATIKGVTEPRKKMVEAEFAYRDERYEDARDLIIFALRSELDSVYLLNLLGKCFIKLNELEPALRCFNKAQQMSPKNIQRLCEIAVISRSLEKKEEGQAALSQAKAMDKDGIPVKEADAAIKIMDEQVVEAKAIMSQLQQLGNVIAFMNNQAVALAKSGKADEGISLYKRTIESIPENRKEMIATVQFNLAFAHLRQDRLDETLELLKPVLEGATQRLKVKTQRLIQQINTAKASGKPLKLANTDMPKELEGKKSEEVKEKINYKEIMASIEMNPGDICCYKVFPEPNPLPEGIKKMNLSPPRFASRDSVERGVSGGLERMMKGSG